MSETKCYKAAIVGGDNPHAKGWVETFNNCPSINELVLCGKWSEDVVNGLNTVENLDQVLTSEKPDIVLICSQNIETPKLAEKAIASGIPTLIEKPVARTVKEIEKIEKQANENEVMWATAFLNRYHPAVRQMKSWIEQGAIGRLVSIEGRMVTSHVASRNPDHWLFSHDLSGGGILHWLAIHTIDLIRYLSKSEFSSVSGHTATSVETIDVEEVASASFLMDNGAVGHIHAGYVLPRRYGDIGLVLRGTDGDITWTSWDYDGRKDLVELQSCQDKWSDVVFTRLECPGPGGPGYGGQTGIDYVEDFLSASKNGEQFVTNGNDALQAMRFVEGVYRSVETGQRQEFKT